MLRGHRVSFIVDSRDKLRGMPTRKPPSLLALGNSEQISSTPEPLKSQTYQVLQAIAVHRTESASHIGSCFGRTQSLTCIVVL